MPKLATAFYDALFPLPPDHILLNMQIQLMASLQVQIISSFVYQCYILVHGMEFLYIKSKEEISQYHQKNEIDFVIFK